MALILDATKKSGDALIASWRIDGLSVLQWQFALLETADVKELDLVCDEGDFSDAAALPPTTIAVRPKSARQFKGGPGDTVLCVEEVYHLGRLKKALRGRLSPEAARLWSIRSEGDLQAAADEWTRNNWIPIGRYYIRPLAHRLAAALAHTSVHPNHLTLGTFFCSLTVALALIFNIPYWQFFAPPLVLLGWIFDWTDGRLARIANKRSDFGSYLDSTLGDLSEDLYYVGIILYLYRFTSFSAWAFLFGTFYFFGKYQAHLSLAYQTRSFHKNKDAATGRPKPFSSGKFWAKAFVIFEDADIRLHFLAFCLLINSPAIPLVFYTFHFHLRWMLRVFLVTLRNLR